MNAGSSWLPPYGWWARQGERQTVLRGWDWMRGACSLMHLPLTLPLALWLVPGRLLAVALWLLVSLLAAAGVGWSLAVDAEGFLFCRTWLGLPISRKRFPRQTPVSVVGDDWAPEGADDGLQIRLGLEDGCELGARRNARALKAALDGAVARFHDPRS
jgi:hypothetical protein